jgi:hypothetical protein
MNLETFSFIKDFVTKDWLVCSSVLANDFSADERLPGFFVYLEDPGKGVLPVVGSLGFYLVNHA